MTTPLDKLLHWYETLSPETLGGIAAFYGPDSRFRDPFNDVRGTDAIRRIFLHMFQNTEQPRFTIKDRMAQGRQGFATWIFTFRLQGKEYVVEGSSHLFFDDDGLVTMHRDYWDAAEELFQKLPVIGLPVKWLRKRFAAH